MRRILLLLVMGIIFNPASSQEMQALRKKHFNLEKGVALSGYDAVAYLKNHKAIKGKKEFAVSNDGIIYYFSGEENKEEFKKDPSKYEPQYGGWCAYAMGKDGDKVDVDPETFKIINGKLYLFYNRFFNNTLDDWNKDESRLHNQADVNWKKTYR